MSDPLLSTTNHSATIPCGPLNLLFQKREASGVVEFLPVTSDCTTRILKKNDKHVSHPSLPHTMGTSAAGHNLLDSMFQIAVGGQPSHGMWQAGESMRNARAAQTCGFVDQQFTQTEQQCMLSTTGQTPEGLQAVQNLTWHPQDHGFMAQTTITNHSEESMDIEMLASVSLTGVTPFTHDDAPHRIRVHRFWTAWSNEGRHEAVDLEDLHMERSWAHGPVFHRFGQSGSLPVRNFFPFLALEDKVEGVIWAMQLAWHGSWQMELYRREHGIAMSAGLGDFERAHWMKTLAPGESLTSPPALVTCCRGTIEDACHHLVELQHHLAHDEPEHEASLPVMFNEWCSSWGHPSHDYLVKTADRLKDTSTKYLVLDDGWAEKPQDAEIQFNGDWIVDESAFPHGLAATTAAIRERGMIPGIWFEFEPCTEGTEAYKMTEHQLHRHGRVLKVGNRHFWDFRDPFTFDYLTKKVIHLLRDNHFGYLKVDYNECIGLGCDGAESLGEGLRQHLLKVQEFFELIRQEVPGIVIENCASGGHRLEPGLVGLTSLSSFSDAHESVEIPIIGANLHRLIPVHKSQIWAVMRPEDSMRRTDYLLTGTFLGRMCISGDVVDLPDTHFERLKEAQEFYTKIAPVLKHGKSSVRQHIGKSYRYPTGWQVVVRTSLDGRQCLVVLHTFEGNTTGEKLEIALPEQSEWKLSDSFNSPDVSIHSNQITLERPEDFTGMAWLMERLN